MDPTVAAVATYHDTLDIFASWAAIFTAAVAVIAYGHFRCERYGKRRRLEAYLKCEKDAGKDQGQRTLTHLVANLGMSETDVLDSALRSRCIKRRVLTDKEGKASGILLEYSRA